MELQGTLVSGYQVDSGNSTRDKRFPLGTLRMQAPYFAALGFDFDEYFDRKHVWGSLNVDIAPYTYTQVKSDHFLKAVHWTDLQPAENFFITYATVKFRDQSYKAIVYNPDPATKPNHFQFPTIMQFIAEKIPDIAYGDKLTVQIPDDHFTIQDPELAGQS